MTNNEIIEEEFKKVIGFEYLSIDESNKAAKQFATTLLSKLNRLDRDKVGEIFGRLNISFHLGNGTGIAERVPKRIIDYLIDQILTLVPEEGITIMGGKVDVDIPLPTLKQYEYELIYELHNFRGKKGRLVFIEDKE